jgi:hypothetical protein
LHHAKKGEAAGFCYGMCDVATIPILKYDCGSKGGADPDPTFLWLLDFSE